MRIALLLTCTLVAGCASPSLRPGANDPAQVTNSINLSGYSPEYKRGFGSGCAVAKDGRAAQRPKGDSAFVQGWQDGLDYCRPRQPR